LDGTLSVLADTSGILTLLDADHALHDAAKAIAIEEAILVPQPILAEVDYLGTKYFGARAMRVFLEDVLSGAYSFVTSDEDDLRRAVEIMSQYPDVPLGVVDSSVMAMAERLHCRRVLTLDRKHFGLVKALGYFEIVL
jgi:uncharacterized protein